MAVKFLSHEVSDLCICQSSDTYLSVWSSHRSAPDKKSFAEDNISSTAAAVRTLKSILKEKGMQGMLELIEGDASSSDDDEEGEKRRRTRSVGSYSARMGRSSEEAIVCHPGSSLVAVMVQALAHRVGYVWVVEEDYSLVGIVVLRDILKVFREQLEQAEECFL